jgi:AcrR family transcriptional regulator
VAKRKRREVARSAEDLERKRNHLLDTAMQLLVEKGYARTTMSDVAKAAGVGRGTVYWHFPSKDDLFLNAVEHEFGRLDEALAATLTEPGPPLDKLEFLFGASFELIGEAPNLFHAFFSVLSGAGEEMQTRMEAWFAEVYGRYNSLVEGLLEEAKAEGTVRADLDSSVAAAAIVAMLDAMFLQVVFGLVPDDPDRITRGLLSLLRDGYAAEPTAPRGE